MLWVNWIKCIKCLQRFDDTRKPCLGSCTHTICLRCKERMRTADCPICERPDAFKETVINYPALEAVKELGEKLGDDDLWTFIPDEQEITTGQCHECLEHSRKLRLCTECAERDGLIRRFDGRWLLITKGPDYEQEFLKIKSLTICAHCALDGAHQEHKIEQFASALSPNCRTKTFYSKSTSSSLDILKTALQGLAFRFEQQRGWPKNRCVLEGCRSSDPSEQLEIERVTRVMLEEIDEKERLCERFDLLALDLNDLQLHVEKTGCPDAPEIREIEEIRSKISVIPRHLTPWDVHRIDRKILKKLEELGSEEVMEAAKSEHLKTLASRKREVKEVETEEEEQAQRYRELQANHETAEVDLEEGARAVIRSRLKLAKTHLAVELAFQEIAMDRLAEGTLMVIFLKMVECLKFHRILTRNELSELSRTVLNET